MTDLLLPSLAERFAVEPVLLWLAASGALLFPAILLIGWVLVRQEGWTLGSELWTERLRFRPMNGADWGWSLAAFGAILGLTAPLVALIERALPGLELAPWFLQMEPLAGRRLWILAAWLPVFALTILAEEVVWRGVVLPRQEAALGRWGWLANGAGWLLFHLALGPAILVSLLSIVVILPWVVQRRANSWVGVAIHAAFNGPGFLATALGWV